MSEVRANLTIVVRNAAPSRDAGYPQTWIVYSAEEVVSVAVAHDDTSHPYMKDKFRCA
jgi:hypothetical protein